MTRDDLFNSNANVIKTIAEAAVEVNPKAILAIITNPVNSCVPIACEVFKKVIFRKEFLIFYSSYELGNVFVLQRFPVKI